LSLHEGAVAPVPGVGSRAVDRNMGSGCSGTKKSCHDPAEAFLVKAASQPDNLTKGWAHSATELGAGKGCLIEKTEERGITLNQLGALVAFLHQHCVAEGWVSTNPSNPCALLPDKVNLYDGTHWVIKPATQARQTSYVELIADGKQPPAWFVSHFWGEAIAAFTKCLEQHAADRQLSRDSPYWVCAYANNQWKLGNEVGGKPCETSFFKAMGLAKGTVSVLDLQGWCYTRVWCVYEIWVSLHRSDASYLYDVYTLSDSGPVGITDGFALADMQREATFFNEDKTRRESKFPMSLIHGAMNIRLETSKASVEADRRQILNDISGSEDLFAEPPSQHEAYDALNGRLAGRFAAAGWRNAVDANEDMASFAQHLQASHLTSLSLCYDGCRDGGLCMDHLTKALPSETLEHLDLDFCQCKEISDESLAALSMSLPAGLKSLCLNINKWDPEGSDVSDTGLSVLAESLPLGLAKLTLYCSGCKLSDVACTSLASRIRNLKLGRLHLDVEDTKVTDKGVVALVEALPDSLNHLDLCLNKTGVSQQFVESLAARAGVMQSLECLEVEVIGTNISDGDNLKVLREGLQHCKEVSVLAGDDDSSDDSSDDSNTEVESIEP